LAGVKVVRNDLSDSDLEIVPAKISPQENAPAGGAEPQEKPAGAWGKVTGRLFAAAKR
jgi:hypothetical protein